jgi:hypothetical protein
MFEDSEKINLLLESGATQASEIYNHFLQLTSTLSLEGISALTNSQIKLVLINSTDLVPGTPSTYKINGISISSARFIADKPFLPTATLEEGAHYFIDAGSNNLLLYKPIESIGFPSRVLPDGTTQYSIWMVDARIDEQLISKYYGNLISISPETSTDNFSNFVYGLYYLYTNGPVLNTIKKALNLVLGIPLARGVETILDIRLYPNSQQYLVTTDSNSYLLPYGLSPTGQVGDVLQPFQELTSWVVIKDYVSDGVWWLNLAIPPELIPYPPNGKDNRATAGSHAEYVMANYLYKNTFLVNVNTTSFKDLELFTKLTDVISRVRPTYTSPIYIWSVPVPDEKIGISDANLTLEVDSVQVEYVCPNIGVFTRDSTTPISRRGGAFTRFSGPSSMDRQVGTSPIDNGTGTIVNGTTVTGFQGRLRQFRSATKNEEGWLKAVVVYPTDNFVPNNTTLSFCRGIDTTISSWGIPVYTNPAYAGFRSVYLHTTSVDSLRANGIEFTAVSNDVTVQVTDSTIGNGDGATSSFRITTGAQTLVGNTDVFKTNWQGRQLQYLNPRTNLLTGSESISNGSNGWYGNDSPVYTTDGTIGPDGVGVAQLLIAGAQNSGYGIGSFQLGIFVLGLQYTMSLFFKVPSSGNCNIIFGSDIELCAVNTTTLKASSTKGTTTLTSVGNGWYRASITFTATTPNPVIYSSNTGRVYIWGAQIERSPVLTSYIKTTTAQVTRTDYSLVDGQVIMNNPIPESGSIISWSGAYSESKQTSNGTGGWHTLASGSRNTMGINTAPINDGTGYSVANFLIQNFSSLFIRDTGANLPWYYPKNSYTSIPLSVSDVISGDFLMFFEHGDDTGISVYWVTSNNNFVGRPYISTNSSDDLSITISGNISRGMGNIGSPYFLTRGSQQVVIGGVRATNTLSIDAGTTDLGALYSNYSDSLNLIQNMDRSGKSLVVKGYF